MRSPKPTKTLYVYELTRDPAPKVTASTLSVVESSKYYIDSDTNKRYNIRKVDQIVNKDSALRLISLTLTHREATTMFARHLSNQADVYSHTADILRNHAAILQKEG